MYRKICVRGINLLIALPPFYVILCCFLCLLPSPSQVTYLLNGPYGWCSVMISWVNGRKYENLLQFYLSWLPALRTWYYFRLCFSFSCFVFDLTLIQKSHALNCYPFLHKFLLKPKITNSLLVTVIAQFTAKTTNSEKAIYFLSIMSFSINKLKSHLLFTYKNLYFMILCGKKVLLQEMVRGRRGGLAPPSPHPHLSLQSCIVLKYHPHHLTKYESKGKKFQFSIFLVNWEKFGNVI